MAFWIIIALMALIVMAAFGRTLLMRDGLDAGAAERSEQGKAAASFDMQVYRDQLDELERDITRGTIDPNEAERARLEISRRLLAADKAHAAASAAPQASKMVTYSAVALSAAVIFGGGTWGYLNLGVNYPGQVNYPDMPLSARIEAATEMRENRPSQAEMEATLPTWEGPDPQFPADYIELIEKLRVAVVERPGEIQGNELLALHEGRLGNFVAAHQAKANAIVAMDGQAGAGDYAQYVDLLALAAAGYISPEAEAALAQVLIREPRNLVGRYYSGLMFAQTGRPDKAFRLWRALLEDSPADAAWVEPVRAQIGQLAAMAGVDYTLPPLANGPVLNGPSAEDIAAAGDMSTEDRMAMVESMVERLMARMASEGGTPPEWAQLITALATLNRTDRALAVWGEAQNIFAEFPTELDMINAAANAAGLGNTETSQ